MKHRVSIALATFNGEQYLSEQLESLVQQTRKPDELIIVDDCSGDSTLGKVRAFVQKAPFEMKVFVNPTNLGYAQNFSRALQLCTGDIVFICDQDDVWLPNKIERVVELLESNPEIQLLIHDVDYCTEGLQPIGQTKIERMQDVFDIDRDFVVGMATAVRGSFLQLCLPVPNKEEVAHDSWLHSCAHAIGKKYILHEILAKYRRHTTNATGFANLNVDYVTSKKHFNDGKLSFRELLVSKTRLPSSQISPLCEWLQMNKSVLEKKGYSSASQIERLIADEIKRAKCISARADLLSMSGAKRFKAILSLFFQGGYTYFSGWKSAVKDLFLD